MAWRTNMGERVLEGVEADVCLTAMRDAVEHLEDTRDLDELEVLTGASFAPQSVRIFWDRRDWSIIVSHAGVLDGMEEALSQPLGLDDYFTNRLPQITAEQTAIALASLHKICSVKFRVGD